MGIDRAVGRRCLASFWLLFLWCGAVAEAQVTNSSSTHEPAAASKPAKLKITGYGVLGDLALKHSIKVLVLSGKKPHLLDANFVEDAALILASTLKQEGYLEPAVTADLTKEDGARIAYKWNENAPTSLPRPLHLLKAHFRIHKGVLYHYTDIRFEGLQTIREKQARSFFMETGLLLPLKRYRVYTPEKLRHGVSSLINFFERQGYENVKATASDLKRDDQTGEVKVTVRVEQGPKSIVRSVREELFFGTNSEPREARTVFPGKPYSRLWEQDFVQGLKTNGFRHGYPDATVQTRRLKTEPGDGVVQLDLQMEVRNGEQIKLGKVEFEGQEHTRPSLMRERVKLKEDSWLDRIKTEQGRYRLAQLGIFDSVDLSYRPEDEHRRDALYKVKESKRTDLSLLFGFGSYELLRGGVELERRNILGLGHDARLKAVQSFKASSGEFYYTIPELVGRDVDVFINGTGLRREEVSFLREEYGGGAGVHKYFPSLASDLSARYNYQILNAAEINGIVATEGVTNPAVGAVVAELKHDRRDNPLYPRKGYKIFATIESGTRYLGGDVDYERVEVTASWHQRLGGGRWLHLGISHGAAIATGTSSNNLPFTRRFFPGGQNSIRGFEEGRASPRDEQGRFVGAESYALGSVEFEQALTPKLSLILFSDSLGEARRIQHYPFDTGLYSVGAGLSWRTVIGPLRVEYGHNLNPRSGDPSGSVQFSFGFPF